METTHESIKLHRTGALTTGISIIIMTIAAGLAMALVFQPLFNQSAEDITSFVMHNKAPFIWGTIGWVVILICDLLASWGLTAVFSEVDRKKAQLMGGLRYLYSAILAVGIAMLIRACFEAETGGESVLRFMSIWSGGLVIFGFHLIALSKLVCARGLFVRILTFLLLIAGIGYVIMHLPGIFFDSFDQYVPTLEAIFMLPMVLGEFALAVWLVVKGSSRRSSLLRSA